MLQITRLYALKVKDGTKKNSQLRISSTLRPFPGYSFTTASHAAVTPAVESTRVPSMSNSLFQRDHDKGTASMNIKERYAYIASKVAVVVDIFRDDWDSDCTLPSHPSRYVGLCTINGINIKSPDNSRVFAEVSPTPS